jgi:hypothetical protein
MKKGTKIEFSGATGHLLLYLFLLESGKNLINIKNICKLLIKLHNTLLKMGSWLEEWETAMILQEIFI